MAAPRKHEIPEIPREFITTLKNAPGKEFIKAEGLIFLGHLQGLKRVDVQIVQAPTPQAPFALVRCEVETDLGVFSDYGEVGPGNKNPTATEYPLSMATTRARNRALRIATNCPLTSYEEMGTESEDANQQEDRPQQPDATKHLTARETNGKADPRLAERDQLRAALPGLIARVKELTGEVFNLADAKTLDQARSLHAVLVDIIAKEEAFATDPARAEAEQSPI